MTDCSLIRADVERDFPDYLRDESRRVGNAESISFPVDETAVREVLRDMCSRDIPVTVQGARTGITGGAVPEGGHILNLSRMNRIIGIGKDRSSLIVQPGVLLAEIRDYLDGEDVSLFFPPDPTETSATIGGMVSCNASGALSFLYGSTRKYIRRLRVILADGSLITLNRGEHKAAGRLFSLKTDSGLVIKGDLPTFTMPEVKNAAGYFVRDDMDMIDLFVGSEGTLGVVTEIELDLAERPAVIWGVMAFMPDETSAISFVEQARLASSRPAAIEYFGMRALGLLMKQKKDNLAFKDLPDVPAGFETAVYLEYHGSDEESLETAVMEASGIMTACGGSEDSTWLASDDRELQKIKNFRHAVPESVNLLIDERRRNEPALTKLGTDLSVPDDALVEIIRMYHDGLDRTGLDYVVFGHIGDNHVHVNIIPRSMDEYAEGKKLYQEWAQAVVDAGGTVSAEHGIGKLKKDMLKIMYGDDGIEQMRKLRLLFDPDERLNRGNLF